MKKLVLPEKGLDVLLGPYDENIKYLESLLDVSIGIRGNEITLDGSSRDVET
ncbi:MAG: phosphate starvation-inducible protein PhoH, partial [bacterium]